MIEIITNHKTHETWDDLKATIHGGNADWLHSGATISTTLKNGKTLVLDVTRDANGEIYFVFHDCCEVRHCMNENGLTKGGWAATDMRKYIHEEILPLFPDDLQAAIEPTKIVQIINGERIECEDKLFCLSYTQVFGKDWPRMNEREPEDSQLDIFMTERARVKERHGETAWWWLRSAYTNYTFDGVYSDGSRDYINANYSGGVALGFKL